MGYDVYVIPNSTNGMLFVAAYPRTNVTLASFAILATSWREVINLIRGLNVLTVNVETPESKW